MQDAALGEAMRYLWTETTDRDHLSDVGKMVPQRKATDEG